MQGQCPNCKGMFEVQQEWIGMQAQCPYCHNQVVIQPVGNMQQGAGISQQQAQQNYSSKTGVGTTNAAVLGGFDCYVQALKNYVNVSGRASRKEYWYFILFNVLIAFGIGILEGFMGTNALSKIYSFAMFLPGLALAVRRLHDINKSGWYFLLIFIPIIGWLILLCYYCRSGMVGANRFGEDPYQR